MDAPYLQQLQELTLWKTSHIAPNTRINAIGSKPHSTNLKNK